jgi:hypothetical protein
MHVARMTVIQGSLIVFRRYEIAAVFLPFHF